MEKQMVKETLVEVDNSSQYLLYNHSLGNRVRGEEFFGVFWVHERFNASQK